MTEPKSNKARKCLTPNCENSGTRRGLCVCCRLAAKRAIESGDATEESLIALGLMKPKTYRGKFASALADRQREENEVSNGQRQQQARKPEKRN
jgi:hypothetical protein